MVPPSEKKPAGKASEGKNPTVLLVDGHSLAYRAFYALPADLGTKSGQPTNAVFGFTSMLIKAIDEHKTRRIGVAFDKGKSLERMAIRPEYKAQRTSAPDEFRQQIGLIHEVLAALQVPIFEYPNIEADDLIAVLADGLVEKETKVVVVTADRDFFQIVGPKVSILMNRRGISDTVLYDEAAIFERYGFGPERYLDYAALRGDPSDNIQGVPGIGEKTALALIRSYGTLEQVFEHVEELKPKVREGLLQAKERLLVNRDFFRFRTGEELATQGVDAGALKVEAEQLDLGEWDFKKIRALFDSLEFRVLYDRLAAQSPAAMEAIGGFDAKVTKVLTDKDLTSLAMKLTGRETVALRVAGDPARFRKSPAAMGFALDGEAFVIRPVPESARRVLSEAFKDVRLVTHGAKDALQRLAAIGVTPAGIAMDTEIAAYLADPSRGSYPLDEVVRRYLDRELKVETPTETELPESGQQSLLEPAQEPEYPLFPLEAVATAELAPVLEKELRNRGAWDLFVDLELPLATLLAKVELAGIKVDVGYLNTMSAGITKELAEIEKRIYEQAGGPFNIGSPPQLRQVLYERLELKPTRRTKTGYSTDARVLESLRDEHPIIGDLLTYREKAKLKSTYIDALPPLVDPLTGRLHCRFNQTVASTGRLSSERPNLQNIPIRTEEGKQIRRAFVADQGHLLLVADYSQIELRILAHLSEDEELLTAFSRGDDIHSLSIAKALGIEPDQVTPKLRSVGKMVSYGVTYGMGPFGLSQRLQIPLEQARTYIEGFFAMYPRVREYLDEVVVQATTDGFTTTMLGRRRYVPELKSHNPRVRSLGERQALNAPIQGSAADVMKLAMVSTDKALEGEPVMVLTVHDELVFEVLEERVEDIAGRIKAAMENAIVLKAPLEVELGWGPNWAEAKS